MSVDQRHRKVECKDCGRQYICAPDDDYYKLRDELYIEGDLCKGGICAQCLRGRRGLDTLVTTKQT